MGPLPPHTHGEGYPTRTPSPSPISLTAPCHRTCRKVLPSTNRFRCCYLATSTLDLQKVWRCYKTPIQPTTAKLNTADGSPMMTFGSTALHLWIAEFKFTHNFIICDQLPDTELIFSIDIQKKFSLSYAWDKDKNCYIQHGMVNS